MTRELSELSSPKLTDAYVRTFTRILSKCMYVLVTKPRAEMPLRRGEEDEETLVDAAAATRSYGKFAGDARVHAMQ